jgi:endonuclease-8
MPEGHKTHFLAQQHTSLFAGRTVRVTSPQGRFSADAAIIDGAKVSKIEAVGKQIFYTFADDHVLQIHLGRYGSFRTQPSPAGAPVGQVRMRMWDANTTLDLRGPTTCRVIDRTTRQKIAAGIGPDPLAGGKPQPVWQAISTSRRPIGALLLDQSVLAGVGNIFRAELLFELQINPLTRGDELTKSQFDQLWKTLVRMMRTGLKYGRIITVTAKEAGKRRDQLEKNERFRIYGHRECPRCRGKISKINVGSRDLYVCQICQA